MWYFSERDIELGQHDDPRADRVAARESSDRPRPPGLARAQAAAHTQHPAATPSSFPSQAEKSVARGSRR